MVEINLKKCCLECKHPHLMVDTYYIEEGRTDRIRCEDWFSCELMAEDNGKYMAGEVEG